MSLACILVVMLEDTPKTVSSNGMTFHFPDAMLIFLATGQVVNYFLTACSECLRESHIVAPLTLFLADEIQ